MAVLTQIQVAAALAESVYRRSLMLNTLHAFSDLAAHNERSLIEIQEQPSQSLFGDAWRCNGVLTRTIASASALLIALTATATAVVAAPIDHRPANFFSSVVEKDKSICSPILQSLNKENRLPPDLFDVSNPNFITDLLLTSDLQVAWRRVPLKYEVAARQLDYASVDLANDGRTIAVVRWDFYDRAGYRNELILPPTLPDEFTSGQQLTEAIVTTLSGENARNVLRIPFQASDVWTTATYPSGGFFDFNILKVGNKAFILGAAAQAAEWTVTRGGGFDAFVIEYHSMQIISVVCHFRGGEKR